MKSYVFGLCLALCCSLSLAATPPEVTVEITKFAFKPQEVTVAPGTKVRWVNHDETPHTVVSAPGQKPGIASKAMDTDDKYEVVLKAEGDYGYLCGVHPFMTGVIHVRKP